MTSPDNAVQAKRDDRPLRFLTPKETAAKVTLSERTIYRLLDSGEFPHPVRPTPTRIAWVEHEVEDWMRERIKERDGARGEYA